MLVFVEIDRRWAGIGVDWLRYIKGMRLGFIAINVVFNSLDVFIQASYESLLIENPGRKLNDK